jgi:hypothetical protein
MTWTPQLAAVDVRAIPGNLKTFFDAHVADLCEWARVETSSTWTFYQTAESRIKTDFPHTGMVRRTARVETQTDGHHVRVELTFETEVAADHAKGERTAALGLLQYESDSRALALESMFLNMPAAELYANVPRRRGDCRQVTTNDPLEAAVSETKSMFNVSQTLVLQFIVGHRG